MGNMWKWRALISKNKVRKTEINQDELSRTNCQSKIVLQIKKIILDYRHIAESGWEKEDFFFKINWNAHC